MSGKEAARQDLVRVITEVAKNAKSKEDLDAMVMAITQGIVNSMKMVAEAEEVEEASASVVKRRRRKTKKAKTPAAAAEPVEEPAAASEEAESTDNLYISEARMKELEEIDGGKRRKRTMKRKSRR